MPRKPEEMKVIPCGCGKCLCETANREDNELTALIWDLGVRTFNANKRKKQRNRDNPNIRFT